MVKVTSVPRDCGGPSRSTATGRRHTVKIAAIRNRGYSLEVDSLRVLCDV